MPPSQNFVVVQNWPFGKKISLLAPKKPPDSVKSLKCIRAPPRRGRYWEIHPRRPISRDPRDFPRAKPEGNLEGRGKSERFSEAVGFAPRDPRDFPRAKPEGNLEGRGKSWEIYRGRGFCTPRVEGCKTHGQGKSRGRRGWISQYLPSLGGARTFSHHYQGRIAPLLQCRPLVVAFKLKLTPSSCYSIDDILSCFITQLS